jgi:predicted O-methyltransferase YrrM
MKFDLDKVELLAKKHDKVIKTGDDFIDARVEGMRNPDGHVAHYYGFFFRLAQMLKPDVVVELGSWQGTSAACFADCGGIVITMDHHSDPGDEPNESLTRDVDKHYHNVIYCRGWTCDKLFEEERMHHLYLAENAYPKMIKALDGDTIDILFIDSWHRYDQAMKDWNAYRPLLSKEALVICDDILQGSPGAGIESMNKFWDEVKGDENFLNTNLHPGYPMGFFKWKK